MRRTDREILDFEQMLAVVEACSCCRLGLIDEAGAYIVPGKRDSPSRRRWSSGRLLSGWK